MEHQEAIEKKKQTEKSQTGDKDFCDFLRMDPTGSYDNLPLGYLLLNENGRIINANISAAGMIGIERADLIGTRFIGFVHQDDRKTFGKDHADPAGWISSPVDIRIGTGKNQMWTRLFFSKNKEGKITCGQKELIFHDITEYKQVEKENSKLKQQLRQARVINENCELSSEVIQDYNTIFYPILGHLEILVKEMPKDSEFYFALQSVLTACKQAKSMAGKIFASNHQTYSSVCPVTVQNVLQEVIELGRSIQPANIKIFKSIDKDCRPVMADPTHIYQIAIHLITHAFHIMEHDGGVLDVIVKEVDLSGKVSEELRLSPGRYVRLSVSDTTSRDADESVKNKIFNPSITITGKKTGTGIGLNTISGIVKEYGGILCYSSKIGKGSRFEVYLPLAHYACSTDWAVNMEQNHFFGQEYR